MRSFAARKHQRGRKRSSERLRKWRRRMSSRMATIGVFVGRWWIAVLGCAAIAVIGLALFSPVLQVREIQVQRTQGRVDVAAVQKALVPFFGKHMLFVQERDIQRAIRAVVPDIETLSIGKQYPSLLFLRITVQPLTARLEFEEQQVPIPAPAADASVVDTASGSGSLEVADPVLHEYLTDSGLYMSTASTESGGVLPLIRIADWSERPPSGSPLFSTELLERLQGTERLLTEEFGHHISVRTVYLRAREYHLSIDTTELWFDMQSPLQEQIGRYRTFLKTTGLQQAQYYVDLRLQGRIVYR